MHRVRQQDLPFVCEGRGRWTIEGTDDDMGPGDILAVKAGEKHHFKNVGDIPLVALDVHLSPTFIQENLT